MNPPSKSPEQAPPLSVIRWPGYDGVPVSSFPLPRPLAEVVAHAFAVHYPRERFWVEDVPWLALPAPLPPEPAPAPRPRRRALGRGRPRSVHP